MAYLPQELVDTIIDYVSDHRLSLFSCALVSRSWLHSSRCHLFANISLSPHAHPHSSNLPPHKLCQRLYEVLQESPTIVPYIRYLQVLDGGPPPHQRSAQWITSERTLPPLLKLLTHLRQFELGASSCANVIQWKSLPFTLQNAVCTVLKLPSLSFFRLHSWTFPNLVSLAAVISSCQNLKGLSLSSVTVCEELDHHHSELPSSPPKSITLPPPPLLVSADNELTHLPTSSSDPNLGGFDDGNEDGGEDDTVNTRVSTPRLEALTLDYVNFGYLGYWLFAPSQSPSPISFGNLRELRISHSADPLVVDQVLLSIGSSLEHLHLKPGHWEVFSFDLRNNSNLKSLRLTLEVPETALSWCTTLLSSLAPASSSGSSFLEDEYEVLQLENISFEFWTDLKKLSTTSGAVSVAGSPSGSPHHSLASLLPSSSASSSSSSPPSSSPLSPSLPLSSESRSHSPESQSSPRRRRYTHQTQPQASWSSLDSILSLLPAPLLKQVDVGLFAQSTSPDFIRVTEILGGIRSRLNGASRRHCSHGTNTSGELKEDGPSRSQGTVGVEGTESGVVRVYQLGLKSQRSFGRISGPRLRCFEGTT